MAPLTGDSRPATYLVEQNGFEVRVPAVVGWLPLSFSEKGPGGEANARTKSVYGPQNRSNTCGLLLLFQT